jgi:hypothetical protein
MALKSKLHVASCGDQILQVLKRIVLQQDEKSVFDTYEYVYINFGIMCTCIYCVLYCLCCVFCIVSFMYTRYLFLIVTGLRTTATE